MRERRTGREPRHRHAKPSMAPPLPQARSHFSANSMPTIGPGAPPGGSIRHEVLVIPRRDELERDVDGALHVRLALFHGDR